MTKLEAAALGVSALSAAVALFAVSETRSATSGAASLSDRVAKIESASPVAAPVAAGPSNADLAREIAVLRSQLGALSSLPRSPGATPSVEPSAASQEAASRAAAEEKRQEEWLNNFGASIVRNLDETLDLSAQQTAQLTDLIKVQLQTSREARIGKSADDARAAMEALVKETNDKIRLLLTAEQQSKFEEVAKRPGGIFTHAVTSPKARPVEAPNGGGLQPK